MTWHWLITEAVMIGATPDHKDAPIPAAATRATDVPTPPLESASSTPLFRKGVVLVDCSFNGQLPIKAQLEQSLAPDPLHVSQSDLAHPFTTTLNESLILYPAASVAVTVIKIVPVKFKFKSMVIGLPVVASIVIVI
jgi:hypothetical protein